MRRIETMIEIDAPPERVWAILTDFASYPEWNPFMPSISGEQRVGGRLTVRLTPPKGGGMTFKPAVRVLEAGRHLAWLGRLVVPGLFDGLHEFVLTPSGAGTTLRQKETFRGLLVPFLGGTLVDTEAGFVQMNEALKARAEAARHG